MGGEQRAASLSRAGSVPTKRRAFTVPTLLLFHLLSNVLFCFSLPFLSGISWPVIFLCTLAVSFPSSLPLDFSLLLICVFVTSQPSAAVNMQSGGCYSVFQNIKKNLNPLP